MRQLCEAAACIAAAVSFLLHTAHAVSGIVDEVDSVVCVVAISHVGADLTAVALLMYTFALDDSHHAGVCTRPMLQQC